MSVPILPSSTEAIGRAAALLRDGRLVAFPTETVYGLGGDATDERAVAAIFAAKGRPLFNPLILHVPSIAEAEALAIVDGRARNIAARFWPGPLTLVLPRRPDSGVSLLASAGLDTVAVRVPVHPIAQALLRATGRPIAAPSANRSGRVSPTEAVHVADEFDGEVAMIIDGGRCCIGLESTVLDLTDKALTLLRPGGIPIEALSALLGPIAVGGPGPVKSPGQLSSHYAPSLPLRLDAVDARQGEALLAFGTDIPSGFVKTLWLSYAGDLTEAAANLFAMLRQLDHPDFSGIAVMSIPEHGLGRAINDRLSRAAALHE